MREKIDNIITSTPTNEKNDNTQDNKNEDQRATTREKKIETKTSISKKNTEARNISEQSVAQQTGRKIETEGRGDLRKKNQHCIYTEHINKTKKRNTIYKTTDEEYNKQHEQR